MPPRVSVLMPAYNRERYIREAIDSVLAQTFADFELIVVDDGSTDRTAAIAEATGDARVSCLRRDHRGISAAMNAGIHAARGGHIARLDSDDVWLPTLLAVEMAALEAQPGLAIAYAKGQAMRETGEPLPLTVGLPLRYPGDPLRSQLYDDFTCNITTLVPRACYERIGGYDESLLANEDWDMWLRMARHYPFVFVDAVLARFRFHPGSTTGPHSPQFAATLESRPRVLDKMFAAADLPHAAAAMRPVAYRNVHTYIGQRWLTRGDPRRALANFTKAVRVSGAPAETVLRIAWATLAGQVLNRFYWGRCFQIQLLRVRRALVRRRA